MWSWHRPEEIVAMLDQAALMIESGTTVSVAVATLGIASATYFRWRKQFAGLNPARLREMSELKQEVSRLRRAIAEIERE
jgi:transposase-like protein